MLLSKIYPPGSAEPPSFIRAAGTDQGRLVGALSQLLELAIPIRTPATGD